jgi:hypothetical protein
LNDSFPLSEPIPLNEASEITFLDAPDGPAEARLKEALAVLLGLGATVTRAYLTRVHQDGETSDGNTVERKPSGIALGLLTDRKTDSEKLARQMSKTFAVLLNTSDELNVVFLSDDREAEIRKACPPFYDRNAA